MAISGSWNNRAAIQAGALKQGTGWNPIHAYRGSTGGGPSDKPPNLTFFPPTDPTDIGLAYLIDQDEPDLSYGEFRLDFVDNPLWSDQFQTGLGDQQNLGEARSENIAARGWPSWGPYKNGLPGGSYVRTLDHGSEASNTPKQQPYETVTEGWLNKARSDEDESKTSDESQYIMQTSMLQRNKVRAGSQRSGSQSDYDQPIPSRTAGKKLKVWSGLLRHYDMEPRAQDLIIRPWWSRTAYTGPTGPDWNESNAQMLREPIQRVSPLDPYMGPEETTRISQNYGYVAEDVTY